MSNAIEFPGAEPSSEGSGEEHVDEAHAEAFRCLETRICDCI
jgi:hypothetical protein